MIGAGTRLGTIAVMAGPGMILGTAVTGAGTILGTAGAILIMAGTAGAILIMAGTAGAIPIMAGMVGVIPITMVAAVPITMLTPAMRDRSIAEALLMAIRMADIHPAIGWNP